MNLSGSEVQILQTYSQGVRPLRVLNRRADRAKCSGISLPESSRAIHVTKADHKLFDLA